MTDPMPSPQTENDDADGTGRREASGLARWQKVVGLVGLVVVVALVVLLLAGDHGPGRHTPSEGREHPSDVEGVAGHPGAVEPLVNRPRV